ncbi:MAG: response regulator [Gemmatales bacterium]|nr:response regulator [Gemmatales bacterium]MDW8386542.1 response regulator [Gemmatales bacterium]
MSGRRVLSVGNCSFDHGNIARFLQQHFGAEAVPADGLEDALKQLRSSRFDLVLVNRVLDADGSSGHEVIRGLKAEANLASVPVMLISNLPDAQEQAVALGAVRGFGKKDLTSPETVELLRPYLSDSVPTC